MSKDEKVKINLLTQNSNVLECFCFSRLSDGVMYFSRKSHAGTILRSANQSTHLVHCMITEEDSFSNFLFLISHEISCGENILRSTLRLQMGLTGKRCLTCQLRDPLGSENKKTTRIHHGALG